MRRWKILRYVVALYRVLLCNMKHKMCVTLYLVTNYNKNFV